MIVAYIKEEKINNRFFKGLEIRGVDNNYIISINDMKNKRIKKKLAKKILKLNIGAIVFSKELEGDFKEEVCELLNLGDKINIQILNGKKLMEFMEFDILKYILEKQKKKMTEQDIYIVFKKDNKLNLNFLKRFIENYRMTNVVTNDIERLKNIQDNLINNDDILISVSNNKRKALKRAKYILNINLKKEELEKYRINREAIIINIQEFIKYDNPGFDGINVNYFEINVPDELEERFEQIGNNFDIIKLYESILLSETTGENIESIYNKIARDEVTVKNIIGNNGVIEK